MPTSAPEESTSQHIAIPGWVVDSGVQSSFQNLSYAIAIISTPHGRVGLYANPTDQRCYRLIARLLVKDPSEMRLNQIHTLQESLAVTTAVSLVKQILFAKTGLFVQSMHLGNNAMRENGSDSSVSAVGLGNEKEPYFYHEHLILRGDPKRSYFPDAPALDGPPLGTAFAAQGTRVAPTPQSLETTVNGLKKVLLESRQEDLWGLAECSLSIV